MENNQNQNMHLLCFDPFYPHNVGPMRLIHYGGSDEGFNIESGAVYNTDGSVSLSFWSPKANKVEVRYRLHNYKLSDPSYRAIKDFYKDDYVIEEMTKDEDGYWRKTIRPGAGFHSIFYLVDGVRTINTQGPYGYDADGLRNFVDIPDDEDTQLHDVPHGSITREIYKSDVTGRYRACWVYTPASYAKSNKEYPVLFIQHGGGQDEVCWFQSGKLDMILDNLIAKGQAEEMVVVCNNGYAYEKIENGQFAERRLDKIIIGECLPFIESKYRVIKDRRSRAVAGLSMGGGHARRLGFGHPDVFANVGVFSSGECFPTKTEDMDFSELFSDATKFNEMMDIVFIGCGDADPRYDKTMADLQPLQQRGLNIEFRGYLGQHEWNVWRYCAKDYVKKIFKNKKAEQQ